MNQTAIAVFAIIGALAAIFLAAFAALAAYDAVSGSGMRDDMGGMVKDMGGMMDGGMSNMMDGMDGMMGGGKETIGSASGRGEVRIESFHFHPTTMNVTAGTVIVWTNEDNAPHTATAKDGSFDTGRLQEGTAGQVTFDTPGTIEYTCNFHSWMSGRIIVGP